MSFKVIKLTSGAELKIGSVPFSDAKELFQVFMEDCKDLKIQSKEELFQIGKDAVCTILSSKKFDQALHKCLERCLYNGVKITSDTFEDSKARVDYVDVIYEVGQETLAPFTKSLYAKFLAILATVEQSQA